MSGRAAADVLDEYLVIQCQLGDVESFERLVGRWNGRFVSRALALVNDLDAAHDVTQDAWVAIVRGLRTLQDPTRFRAWSLAIVANKARDWIRRETSRRRTGEAASSAPRVPSASPDVIAIRHQRVRRVLEGLAELGGEQRVALTLFYLDGLSTRDIAETLGIPIGTVKSRLHHARLALRAKLEEAR